jgi:uncharacterized protein YjbI with pentapeptide repeats
VTTQEGAAMTEDPDTFEADEALEDEPQEADGGPAAPRAAVATATHGRWRTHWRQQGQFWRSEPEIAPERQRELAERRLLAPHVARGVYPFSGMRLTRADVEWLLATHESGRGPVDWSDEAQRERAGLDLRGADLRGVNLRSLPLARLLGGLTGATPAQREAATLRLDGADLRDAHLEGAELREARLDGARLDGVQACLAQLARAHLPKAGARKAHFEGASFRNAHMEKVNFNEAHLERAELSGARLEGATLSEAYLEGASLGGARLQSATLRRIHFEAARFYGAHLENASLSESYLHGAQLRRAHLEGADLSDAHFEGLRLAPDDLARIRRWKPDFPATLPPADVGLAFFDAGTVLEGATLGDETFGYLSLADVRWGDVNLSVVRWSRGMRRRPIVFGDERTARTLTAADSTAKSAAQRLADFEAAVRANRQLSLALQAQGLNEDAARFAYRAQVLQRIVLRRQGRVGTWLFSHFLDGLAGYGYKPGRSLVAYVAVILTFAAAYFFLSQGAGGPQLAPDSALIFSVTSFHGRGFFPGGIAFDSPLTRLAAAEAVVGLIIEISFIATFTQRFFGK